MKLITQQEIIELSLFKKYTTQMEIRHSQLLDEETSIEPGPLSIVRIESGLEVVAS